MSGAGPQGDRRGTVTVSDLVRSYGDVVAVDGISFAVEPGEMFGLIGPDGAGKTTTLRVVLGLLRADRGEVRACGLESWSEARALAARIGYLPQRFSLYGDLSVDENIAFFADVHGVDGWRGRRDELLSMLRLEPFRARLADRLSGGMKQKLALACTLIHTPELLVLDEPTTGVDPVSRREFWRILSQLQKQGITILLTTPYLDEAERCQRVALVNQGRVLHLDTPDRLRLGARSAIVEVLATPHRRAAEVLRGRHDVASVVVFGERLHVTLAGVDLVEAPARAEALRAALTEAGLEVQVARATTASLEDIFIASVGNGDGEGRSRPLSGSGADPDLGNGVLLPPGAYS